MNTQNIVIENQDNQSDRGILLAVMAVEFQEGDVKDLYIHINDDPLTLAKEFCQQQGYNEAVIEILVENIRQNKTMALQDLEKSSNYSTLKQNNFSSNQQNGNQVPQNMNYFNERLVNNQQEIQQQQQQQPQSQQPQIDQNQQNLQQEQYHFLSQDNPNYFQSQFSQNNSQQQQWQNSQQESDKNIYKGIQKRLENLQESQALQQKPLTISQLSKQDNQDEEYQYNNVTNSTNQMSNMQLNTNATNITQKLNTNSNNISFQQSKLEDTFNNTVHNLTNIQNENLVLSNNTFQARNQLNKQYHQTQSQSVFSYKNFNQSAKSDNPMTHSKTFQEVQNLTSSKKMPKTQDNIQTQKKAHQRQPSNTKMQRSVSQITHEKYQHMKSSYVQQKENTDPSGSQVQDLDFSMKNWRIQNWQKEQCIQNQQQRSRNEQNFKNENMTFSPTINPISKQIIEQKFNNKQNVHERLYKHALRREELLQDLRNTQNQQQQQQMNSTNNSTYTYKTPQYTPIKEDGSYRNTSKSPLQVSNRLYNNSKTMNITLKKKQESIRLKKEEEELKECTHMPQINQTSNLILKNKRRPNVQEELYRNSDVINYKKKRLKSLQMENEAQKCPFTPQISDISAKKAERVFKGNLDENEQYNVYDRLYHNKLGDKYSEQKQIEYQKDQDQKFTFQPQLNQLKKSQDKIQTEYLSKKFIERQELYEQDKQQRIGQISEQQNQQIDPQTGQKYFQPNIGKNSVRNQERSQVQNVHEHLYKQRCKSIEKLLEPPEQPGQKTSEGSEKILSNLKKQKFKEIFQGFDSENSGVISAQSINIKGVNPKILEIVAPVLYEMEEFNFSLTYQEFYDAIDRLMKTLTTQQKAELLNYNKKHKTEEQFNRTPTMSKKSKQILEDKQLREKSPLQ